VREVLSTSQFDDVKIEAMMLAVMAEDTEAIPLLIERLEDGGSVMRQSAQAIARIDGSEAQKAREPLVRAIEKGGPRDKVILAWALAKLGDERAFRPLLDGYIDGYTRELQGWDDEFLIDYAASDPDALEEMIKLADSDDDSHRWFAARTMGKLHSDRVVEPLLGLLEDPNKNVVKEAAISLGATGDERAGEAILKVLNQYPEMTDELLRSIQRSVGAPGLHAVYEKVESPSRKNKIVNLIREVQDPRAGDLLVAILEDVEEQTEGKGPSAGVRTRKEITLALADLGDERAIPLIEEFIHLDDIEVACKLYDCGPVNVDALGEDQVENYIRGYRLSPVIRDMVNGLVNIGTPEAKQVVLDLWHGIEEANQKYGSEGYLYWPARPALVMSALGRFGGEDVGPLLIDEVCSNSDVNMRAKALNVGATKDLAEPCPDIGAAARALGRIDYEPALEKFIEIAERPEGVDFTVPSVDNESIYMDRQSVLTGMAFMGSPEAFEHIVTIIEDPDDDYRTREAAVYPLAYCIDESNREQVIEKVLSTATDLPVRILYANALKFQADPAIAQRLLPLMSETTPNALLVPTAKVLGESCDASVMDQLVEVVTGGGEQETDALADYQNAALFAVTLCGEPDHLKAVLPYLNEQNVGDIVRHHYQEFPFQLTSEAYRSGRVLEKLRAALWLKEHDVVWAWQYLTGRLEVGFEQNPDGLSTMQIRDLLFESVESGTPWEQRVAAWALLGMKARGYLLALAAEGGETARVAREVLREES
jgi:HEAT repeat protein